MFSIAEGGKSCIFLVFNTFSMSFFLSFILSGVFQMVYVCLLHVFTVTYTVQENTLASCHLLVLDFRKIAIPNIPRASGL